MNRLLSVEAMGGFYGHIVNKPRQRETVTGFIQHCSSAKCSGVLKDRKYTTKHKTAISKDYLAYVGSAKVVNKTTFRSKLLDFCPVCGYTLFTECIKVKHKEDF